MNLKKKVIVVAMILLATLAFAQKVVILTGEWEPYVGEKLPGGGPSTEIVAAICKEAKIDYEFQFVPWARAEAEVAAGNAFAAFPYLVTDERRKTYDYTEAIQKTRGLIYYVTGNGKDIAWKSLKDFSGSTFGGVSGFWYLKDLADAGFKVDATNSTEAAFKMLKAARFQYLIEDSLTAVPAIKSVFGADAANVKTLAKPYNEATLNLIVSRKYANSKALTVKFNTALATLRKSGAIAAILAKYGIKE